MQKKKCVNFKKEKITVQFKELHGRNLGQVDKFVVNKTGKYAR